MNIKALVRRRSFLQSAGTVVQQSPAQSDLEKGPRSTKTKRDCWRLSPAATVAAGAGDPVEGAIELRLRLRGLEELARCVQSWGRWAEVLAPAALKDRVQAEGAAVVGLGG